MKLLRRWRTHRRAKAALRFLAKMDLTMIRSGFNYQQRKQFWQDFIKSPASRAQALSNLYRFYGGRIKMRPIPTPPVIRRVEPKPEQPAQEDAVGISTH